MEISMGEYEKFFDANRKRWDELVAIHIKSKFYDLEGFKAGKTSLLPPEIKEMGDVTGKSLLHLQCHFGMDTLSWARQGAIVTGMDFSPKAIEQARSLSEELHIPARFICANVFKMPEFCTEQFDIVFTSYGVLCWIPNLQRWAEMLIRCLKPGGVFYIIDTHPFGDMMNEKYTDKVVLSYPYENEEEKPMKWEEDGTYADDPNGPKSVLTNKTEYGWFHGLGSVLTALVDAGLVIDFLHEFPLGFHKIHPDMKRREDGLYEFEILKLQLPLMFSIKAHKKKD